MSLLKYQPRASCVLDLGVRRVGDGGPSGEEVGWECRLFQSGAPAGLSDRRGGLQRAANTREMGKMGLVDMAQRTSGARASRTLKGGFWWRLLSGKWGCPDRWFGGRALGKELQAGGVEAVARLVWKC